MSKKNGPILYNFPEKHKYRSFYGKNFASKKDGLKYTIVLAVYFPFKKNDLSG